MFMRSSRTGVFPATRFKSRNGGRVSGPSDAGETQRGQRMGLDFSRIGVFRDIRFSSRNGGRVSGPSDGFADEDSCGADDGGTDDCGGDGVWVASLMTACLQSFFNYNSFPARFPNSPEKKSPSPPKKKIPRPAPLRFFFRYNCPMSLADRDGFIWMDGRLVPWRDATVHVLAHGLHYGVGVFEGVRVYETRSGGPAVFRLADHTARLFNSARIIGMKLPADPAAVSDAQRQVVRENKLGACYIRPFAFYGAGKLGISAADNPVHLVVAAWPWGAYLGEDAMKNGIRVKTSSFARHHVNVSMCRAKACGHYLNSVLAFAEVARNGYDEALLLDVDGLVAEGSGENLFIVRRGKIFTPDLTSALEGITRESVMTLAQDAGYEVREKRITRDEVYCADEAFFTGTAAEVTPIREVDDRPIGNGKRGPVTAELQDAFFKCVRGEGARSAEWLTPVNEK